MTETSNPNEPSQTGEPAGADIVVDSGELRSSSTGISAPKDEIGAGRYILSFLLAGFIGLLVAYLLRSQGWLAIWINAAIFVVLVVLIVSVS